MNEVLIFGLIILYKIISIVVGLAFAYMGYRLFLNDKSGEAGSFEAEGKGLIVKLRHAAPGVFFSLFGAALISVSVAKGISYSHEVPSVIQELGGGMQLIPDKPPF